MKAVCLENTFVHIVGAFDWDEQVQFLTNLSFSKNVFPYRYGFDKLNVLLPEDAGFSLMSSKVEGS